MVNGYSSPPSLTKYDLHEPKIAMLAAGIADCHNIGEKLQPAWAGIGKSRTASGSPGNLSTVGQKDEIVGNRLHKPCYHCGCNGRCSHSHLSSTSSPFILSIPTFLQ